MQTIHEAEEYVRHHQIVGVIAFAVTFGAAAVLIQDVFDPKHDVEMLIRLAKWSGLTIVAVFGVFGFVVAWIRGMADDEHEEDGPEQNYDIHEVLGEGAFGKVVRATVKHTIKDMNSVMAQEKSRKGQATHHDEQDFAIKYLLIENAKTATDGIMEATRLVRCNHPNIVTLREQFFRNRWSEMSLINRLTKSPFQLCLVMERCDGDVMQLIQSWVGAYNDGQKPWGEEPLVGEKLRIVAQITSAVACIHGTNPALIHRDLKPENVFIAHQHHPHTGKDHLHVKIGDLGLVARQEDDADTKGFAGTPGYIAPELYQFWNGDADAYDERCDIWSIGMILADLLLPASFAQCGGGSAAFQVLVNTPGIDADDVEDEGDTSNTCLRLGATEPLRAIVGAVQASNCGQDAVTLLTKLLEMNPSKRPYAQQLLSHRDVLGRVTPPINVH